MSHTHKCSCDHEDVKFCKQCNIVYCKSCNQEWSTRSNLWYHNYPYTLTTGQNNQLIQTDSAGLLGGGTINYMDSSCKHE